MTNNIYENKRVMLEEYEKQLDYLIKQYNKKNISTEDCLKYIQKLRRAWTLNRVDFKNNGTEESNTIKYLEYEKFMRTSYPKWFVDERGKGSIFTYKNKDTYLFIECVNDGNLEILFRGIDFNNYDQKRVPIWLDINKITINNEILFEGNKLVWHNQSIKLTRECEDAEILYLKIESKTIYDYYPELTLYLDKFDDNTSLQKAYSSIKKYFKTNKENIKKLNNTNFFKSHFSY